jgi:hypothetical protein
VLILIIFAVISIAVLAIALVASRGRASRRNRTSELSLETEVDYKARNDRIPNLEETLKVYGFPQKERFEAHAAQTTLSPEHGAGPGPTGRQAGPKQAPRRDSLAEAS